MYAIAPSQSNKAITHLARLKGLNEKLFRISRAGYVRNAFEGFFSKEPLQAGLYSSRELAQELARDARRGTIDVIITHLVRMAEYARPFDSIPRILDMTDSIHLHYVRMPRLPFRPQWLAARIERERLLDYEPAVASWFDHVLLASPLDIAWLRRRHTPSNLHLVPTGIELNAFPFYEGPYDSNRIVFVGKLDYLPNTDAAIYFAKEIMPRIRRVVPGAEFVVVGWNPPRAIRELARKSHTKVLANVADVRPEVTQSAVSVAPMRFGAGIQVKVLESLALGTPAVATESVVGAFGEEGREAILVGRDPDEFAEQVTNILKNRAYREQLRRAGRKLIEARYQWEQVLAPLDRILNSLAANMSQAKPELSLKGKPI